MVLKSLLATLAAFAVVGVCSQVSLADDKPAASADKKAPAKAATTKKADKASKKAAPAKEEKKATK